MLHDVLALWGSGQSGICFSRIISSIADSVYPIKFLLQTLKQKSNTCTPICLICKFGASVTLLTRNFYSPQ
jgi:hypothetical protein